MIRSVLSGWVLAIGLGCGPARASEPVDYTVHIDAALRRLTVSYCPARMPERLIPGTAAGYRLLESVVLLRAGTPARRLTPGKGLRMPDARPGDCLRFTYDAEQVSAATSADFTRRLAPSRFLWPAIWLWRPAKIPPGWGARLRFDLPEGVRVSTAWPEVGGVHRLTLTALHFRSRVVIGPFATWSVPIGDRALKVAGVGALPDRALLDPWIRHAGRGVASIFGGLPASAVQVLLVSEGGDQVGFGMAHRGGGPGLIVWVGQGTGRAAFQEDWTLAHELFHLGMPGAGADDAWFAEGITTYGAYVAMARAGQLSAEAAWRELHLGFVRGRRAGRGRTLAVESAGLGRFHNYLWVYWGGAAWALLADLRLRRDGRSLDALLQHWGRHGCCGPLRPAAELLAEADAWVGAPWPSELANRLLASADFADLKAAYAGLGLVARGDALSLEGAARDTAIRAAIMKGR